MKNCVRMGCKISIEAPERVVLHRSSVATRATETTAAHAVDISKQVTAATEVKNAELGTFFSLSSTPKCVFCEHLGHPSSSPPKTNIGKQQSRGNQVKKVKFHKSGWSAPRKQGSEVWDNKTKINNGLTPIWAQTPKKADKKRVVRFANQACN